MIKNRIIVFCLWVLSLVGISFFGGPISYGFFYTITLIPVVSVAYLIFVFLRFKVYQHLDSKTAVVDKLIPFYFTLQNEDWVTFSGIRVKYFSTFSSISELEDDKEYEILPHTGIDKNTSLICKYRGEYEVGIKYIEITDLFRLFRFRYKNPATIKVDVKPKLVKLEKLRNVDIRAIMTQENMMNVFRPDVLSRKYETGDDIRLINWKMSANKEELYVRKQIGEDMKGISIILATKRTNSEIYTYLPVENKMIEIVLALALYFKSQNIPTLTAYYTNKLEQKRVDTSTSFEEYYNAISSIVFRDGNSLTTLTDELKSKNVLDTTSITFVVASEFGDEEKKLVDTLIHQNRQVILYLVSDCESCSKNNLHIISVSPDADLAEVM